MNEVFTANPHERTLLRRMGLDTVEGAFACTEGEHLDKPGLRRRRRIRLEVEDASGQPVVWYLKRYGPEPLRARLWRRLAGRGRFSPAATEARNVRRLERAGVPTMRVLAVGQDDGCCGAVRGYLVVQAVPGEALERCFQEYLRRFQHDEEAMGRFDAALVDLVGGLHAAGYVHRDLYASHIFLDDSAGEPRLYLIDLARVFAPRWRRFRWRVKDLAQLRYSMPAEWVERRWRGFLEAYLEKMGGPAGGSGGLGRRGPEAWDSAIRRKVASMRRRQRRKRRAEERA